MSPGHRRRLLVEEFLREAYSYIRAVLAGRAPVRRPLALVVDEYKDITHLESVFLQREGFDTVEAHDGVTALRLARQLSPAIILLDYMMPGLDGLQVLAELRAHPVGRRPAVILQTACDRPEIMARAAELGADFYLIKPFNAREMLEQAKRLTTPTRS